MSSEERGEYHFRFLLPKAKNKSIVVATLKPMVIGLGRKWKIDRRWTDYCNPVGAYKAVHISVTTVCTARMVTGLEDSVITYID